jgi:hypothetical protein
MTLMETAQLLGNFGEFFGAIAVVVTLVYLAVQVRYSRNALNENTTALKRSETHATYEQHDRYRLAMLDPEVAEMWVKGLAGEDLSPADRLRFMQLAIMTAYSAQNNWDAGKRGIMEGDEWRRIAPIMAQTFFGTPGGSQFWEQFGASVLQPGFVDAVTEAYRSTSNATG